MLEANANIPQKCDIQNVDLKFGVDMFDTLQLKDALKAEDIHIIPTISANAGSSGIMKKECFDYIESYILRAIKENIHSIDGIYLHLHGASYVEEIGSGDHHILKEIRKIVGPYLPIGIACDPHGNLTKEYVENATIIRSYRESPHTDIEETNYFVASHIVELIRNRKTIKPIYRKLPLILGGEQSVSTDEPVRSINQYLDELEKDERILSASWHVGYLRHDCPEAGCGIIVIPNDEKDKDYASEVADRLARYVWDKRHEFHYTGLTLDPEETVKRALQFEDKPVFITDSGDNVTSGAMGANTFILHQFLEQPNLEKKVLFASINDPKSKQILENANIGDEVDIQLGMGIDALTTPCDVEVEVKYKGRQEGTYMYGEEGDYGGLVTIHIKDTNIDVVVTDNNHSFVEKHQIDACGVDWDDYDIIVVKQGYIHPELKEKGKLNIMSLTNGATPQDTRLIPFKRIMRPMYPIDEI